MSNSAEQHLALVGNPNAGKTTLFNALTGLRAKTSNFPGTTIEHRSGTAVIGSQTVQLLDLPGLYGINSATNEERVSRAALLGELDGVAPLQGVVLLLDATNLERNLYLASQVIEIGLPTIVALNMIDLAESERITIDIDALAKRLGCPVIPTSARSGRGVPELREAMATLLRAPRASHALEELAETSKCASCPHAARYDWTERVTEECRSGQRGDRGERTRRIDQILTHPVFGTAAFLGVMLGVFALIFWVAQYPMDWIDAGFGAVGSALNGRLPDGDLKSLLVNGIIGGVGGILVFLPQICILFFFLSLLEDTGYLARAAFVMDRLMRRVGLPGKAFVPMLSAHACAVPAIMATRGIDDWRDRLVTIMVLPLLTCSARIPVYTMVVALLFPHNPLAASALFTGAYLLGIVAALSMAWIFKRTIMPGQTQPLMLELPSYKIPSLRTALLTTGDRAQVFVRKAGTVILAISVVLWALSTYPKSEPPPQVITMQTQALQLQSEGRSEEAAALKLEAELLRNRSSLESAAAGRLGHFIEPVIAPLGFDWQIGVGILSSFAAREVIVSTLAIVYGVSDASLGDNSRPLQDKLRAARRSDGSLVFNTATCASLLVFYVLAMQCLPTQAITRRETGGWYWPLFQVGYMTALAYTGAFIAHETVALLV